MLQTVGTEVPRVFTGDAVAPTGHGEVLVIQRHTGVDERDPHATAGGQAGHAVAVSHAIDLAVVERSEGQMQRPPGAHPAPQQAPMVERAVHVQPLHHVGGAEVQLHCAVGGRPAPGAPAGGEVGERA